MLTQNKIKAWLAFAGRASFYANDIISTSIPIGTEAETRVIKSQNLDNWLNLKYLHVDADILIVFVQDVLKLVHVWNLNVMEHRNIVLENNLVIGTQVWMDKCIGI